MDMQELIRQLDKNIESNEMRTMEVIGGLFITYGPHGVSIQAGHLDHATAVFSAYRAFCYLCGESDPVQAFVDIRNFEDDDEHEVH